MLNYLFRNIDDKRIGTNPFWTLGIEQFAFQHEKKFLSETQTRAYLTYFELTEGSV